VGLRVACRVNGYIRRGGMSDVSTMHEPVF
jgi:hypothetical protein